MPVTKTASAAEKLWARLARNFQGAEKTIVEIIETRAWEPLGYESFSKAWVDRMADIPIATAVLPHVVYALLAETDNLDNIADLVKGMTPAAVANLKRQRDAGISPDRARRRREERTKPAHRYLTIEVEAALLPIWQAKAKRVHRTVAEIVVEAAAEHFEQMK